MSTIGAFEAKTHLSALLERVSRGEEITITLRGKAIARLVPAKAVGDGPEAVIEEMRRLRDRTSLDGLSWQSLRDEGRR